MSPNFVFAMKGTSATEYWGSVHPKTFRICLQYALVAKAHFTHKICSDKSTQKTGLLVFLSLQLLDQNLGGVL